MRISDWSSDVCSSDLEAASAPGLAHTETVEFSSMISVGEGGDAALRLGDLRALGEGFPLRGRFLVDDARGEREADGIPAPGTLWMQIGRAPCRARVCQSV